MPKLPHLLHDFSNVIDRPQVATHLLSEQATYHTVTIDASPKDCEITYVYDKESLTISGLLLINSRRV